MHAPLRQTYQLEWRSLADLATSVDEWRALAASALEPNVFYEPAFALAAAPVFGSDTRAVLVRTTAGKLVGLFPGHPGRLMVAGWVHPYAPLGVPLVDRDEPEAVIAAWLDHLGHDPAMPGQLLLPLLPEQGAFAQALDAVLLRDGRRSEAFSRHERALLAPGDQRQHYLERAMSAGKRKELRRQRRRLEDIAPVTADTVTDAAGIEAALKDFMVLEASGWKGIAGTAMVNDAAIRTFVHQAVTGLAAEGKARIDRLFLNGTPIAATLTLASGDTAWCWKIAYNEGMARSSPGVQLVCELTDSLLAAPEPARVDSCAAPGHPMIDHVWRERLVLSDRMIELRPSPRFALVCRFEGLRRAAFQAAKAVRDRLRHR
jgi:CelD/BcsL family acetyltransferase involved in cellulose biosynthesis